MEAAQRRQDDGERTHVQGETLKVKRPSVLWVSTEVACQVTVYSPGGSFGRLTDSLVWSPFSKCGSALSTRAPCALSTSIVLKSGSTPSV